MRRKERELGRDEAGRKRSDDTGVAEREEENNVSWEEMKGRGRDQMILELQREKRIENWAEMKGEGSSWWAATPTTYLPTAFGESLVLS